MRTYCLKRSQFLPITIEAAWPFFCSPKNLEQITPHFLHFQILSDIPEQLYSGLIITYRISAIGGIPMTWVTEIKHVEPLRRFVDEQRLGPFRFWHHEHRFTPVAGGIVMEDEVNYVMPMGWFGRLLHRLLVAPRLERIFAYRRDYLERYFK